MKHHTHTTWLKWIGGTIAALSVVIGLSFNAAVHAQQPSDMQLTQEVQKAVTCFVYARHMQEPAEVMQVYLYRIGKASESAGAVYRLGYVEGLVDGLASGNSKALGGFKPAQLHAAKYLYNLIGCTINESI